MEERNETAKISARIYIAICKTYIKFGYEALTKISKGFSYTIKDCRKSSESIDKHTKIL